MDSRWRRSWEGLNDLFELLLLLPRIEFRRRTASLHEAVAFARRSGKDNRGREAGRRTDLRRLVSTVDRFFPGGPNCVRRVLLEMAMDREASQERLLAGLRTGGGPKSGHAWLESESVVVKYDTVIAL
jgi:hypothetical protein